MVYKIYENGEEINRIVSDEQFVEQYCAENGYTYEPEEEEPVKKYSQNEAIEYNFVPSDMEQIRADIDFLAAMTGVTL